MNIVRGLIVSWVVLLIGLGMIIFMDKTFKTTTVRIAEIDGFGLCGLTTDEIKAIDSGIKAGMIRIPDQLKGGYKILALRSLTGQPFNYGTIYDKDRQETLYVFVKEQEDER